MLCCTYFQPWLLQSLKLWHAHFQTQNKCYWGRLLKTHFVCPFIFCRWLAYLISLCFFPIIFIILKTAWAEWRNIDPCPKMACLKYFCSYIFYAHHSYRIYLVGQSAGAHIAACALLNQAISECGEGDSSSWSVSQIKAYFGISGG